MWYISFFSKTLGDEEQIPSSPHQCPCIYVWYIFCKSTIKNMIIMWNFDVISNKFSAYRITA
jgi:hypothetical protein